MKEMFKMIDADGSGQITLEELKRGLEKVGASIKESEIDQLMQAVSAPSVEFTCSIFKHNPIYILEILGGC